MSESLTVIPVFYTELMLAEAGSFSPSAAKPRHVLSAWQNAELPLAIRAVEPVSEVELCLAHDPAFVRGILAGELANGFGTTALDVARSLPYTTGAMLGAARAALKHGCACAPVSGFHHAQYDSAAGYCTFNGLVCVFHTMPVRDFTACRSNISRDAGPGFHGMSVQDFTSCRPGFHGEPSR